MSIPETTKHLQAQLLSWFEAHQRPLPWRIHYRPYEVWISEIMLQQTQVKTVLPYYERWMKILPTVKSIAEIDEDQLMKLWEGLGYYSRARNAQKAAQVICTQYNEEFPTVYSEILKLPGIGPYTAGAICSIAFNQPIPAVDGNVIRVISRVNCLEQPVSEIQKQITQIAQSWIPEKKARWFNQALMELGASICLPKNPGCLICPIQQCCEGFAAGKAELLPLKSNRTKPKPVVWTIALVKKEDQWLVRKRPDKGLMAGLWEFPSVQGERLEKNEALIKEWLQEAFGLQISIETALVPYQHRYTSFLATVHAFECSVQSINSELNQKNNWKTIDEIQKLALPTLQKKLLQSIV